MKVLGQLHWQKRERDIYKLWGASRSLWEGLGLGELHGPPEERATRLSEQASQGGHWGQGEQARESSWIKGHGRG